MTFTLGLSSNTPQNLTRFNPFGTLFELMVAFCIFLVFLGVLYTTLEFKDFSFNIRNSSSSSAILLEVFCLDICINELLQL
jgi:hypothetical protein